MMHLRTAVVPVLLLTVVACSRNSAPPPTSVGGTRPVDPATAAVLVGRVSFQGTPPEPERLRMQTDRSCLQGDTPNPAGNAVLVSGSGGLQNAFVYVKDGLDASYSFRVPAAPAILDQKGCIYTPRVLGVVTGQQLEVVNSDDTMHNVHALPMANDEFNHGQRIKGERLTRHFSVPEVMVRFKCDVHGWMAAYVGVVAHPFFSVSDADGRFEIKGVPPGTYTVGLWHEKFGTQEQTITIGPKETQTLNYTVSANGAAGL